MGFTSNDVANHALALIGGNQPLVQGQAPTVDAETEQRLETLLGEIPAKYAIPVLNVLGTKEQAARTEAARKAEEKGVK